VAITTLHATTFQVGLLIALQSAAFLVIGLPAGAWCDRMRRRPVLITSDLVRAVVLLTVPAAALFDRLTLPHLYAVAITLGVAQVFFDVSHQSYLPALVGREHLVDGNGKLEASRTVAYAAGPAAGGYLVQWLGAPFALVADALTYLWSVGWLARIRTREPVPDPARRAPLRTEIAEGVRFVFHQRVLRAIALSGATGVLFGSVAQAVMLVFLVRDVELSAGRVGLLMTIGSAGAVGGALLTTRLSRRLGTGRSLIGFQLVVFASQLLLPLTGPGWRQVFFVVANTIVAAFVVAYNVVQVSYRQTICPDHLLGRMNATMRFIMWGMIPVGGLLGGALGTAVGARTTLWIAAAGVGLSVLWLIFSPLGPAAWHGVELERPDASEQSGALGQGADADQAEHVRVGGVPVDGVGLGDAVAVPAEQSEHGAGVPGQRDQVDIAAGAADRLAGGGGVLVDGGQQAGVAQGGDETVDTDTGHELVEDGVGGENPG
jgi:predicted MFS family arabinose efflux permease